MTSVPTAPKKESAAPILTVDQAKVRLLDPEFSAEPVEVEGKDGKKWTRDPGLNSQIEIVDDMDEGDYDGIRFYQNFRLLWNEDEEYWELRDGGSFGALLNVHAKTRTGKLFDFGEQFTFNAEEWDGFEFMTKIVPKKNPTSKQECGSMCHHETIIPIPDPNRKKKKSPGRKAANAPEADLTAEDEALMNETLG